MGTRLVLGSGALGQALVDALSERPGQLVVADEDEDAVRTLREGGVSAYVVDLHDPEAIREALPAPATVAVAIEDGSAGLAVARAARTAFPDAFLLVCGGIGTDLPPEVDAVADDVARPLRATTDFLTDRVGNRGLRTRKLMRILRGIDGRLAIVTHDNPDPDAIASAVALDRLATTAGCSTDICYFGEINHQENRAMVNLLGFDLVTLDAGADLSEYEAIALVDHSQPGVNDGLPADLSVDVVVDHHPPNAPVEARFVDLRSEVGATSTLLVDYFRDLGHVPDRDVATGLLFGIRVDTDGFTREVSATDFEAAGFLQPHADLATLERIESPSVNAETIETIARAIDNRERHGSVLTSGVGRLTDRDALAQAADRLLGLEDVTVTFVYGIADGTVYVSARSRGTDVHLGEALRDAFGQIGSAGGHADMAGAQIPLGILESMDADEESLPGIVDSVLSDRFLDAIESRTHRVLGRVYPGEFHGTEGRGTAPPDVAGIDRSDEPPGPTTAEDDASGDDRASRDDGTTGDGRPSADDTDGDRDGDGDGDDRTSADDAGGDRPAEG